MILDVLLYGVPLLGILVFLHEAGHFVVAKLLRVPVFRFSLGFGSALFQFKKGETTYQVSVLPLGGYVSMAEERTNEKGELELVDRFGEEPWWKRVVIALAGPAANLVTGMVALVIASLVGVSTPDFDPILGTIPATSKAVTQYGLTSGTRLIAVDGQKVDSYLEFVQRVNATPDRAPLSITVVSPGTGERTIELPLADRKPVLSELAPPEGDPIVGSVVIGTPAYANGLQPGDRILAIQGKPLTKWSDLTETVGRSTGIPLEFDVERGPKRFKVTMTPQETSADDGPPVGRIGIEAPRARNYILRLPLKEAIANTPALSREIIKQTFAGLWKAISHPAKSAGSLGGPQMIMQIAAQSAKKGAGDFIYVLAVISFAIMAFNLLPLPVLDGGHVFLAAVEAIRRRPPTETFTMVYQRVGLVLIGCFFVYVVGQDLVRSIQHRVAVSRNSNAPQGEARPAR